MSWFDQFRQPPSFNEEVPYPGGPPPVPPEVGPPTPPPEGPAGPSFGSVSGGITGTPPWGAPPPPQMPGVLEGWNPEKWANQSHQTHKYKVGRILAKYPPTVEGLKKALPELQAAYPGARIVGLGDLDLGLGEAPVDVLRAASQGGTAWQWVTADGQQGSQGGPLPPDMAYQGMPSGVAFGGGSFGGGGSSGGGSSSWSMPRGSEYQFAGAPGPMSAANAPSGQFGSGQIGDPMRRTTSNAFGLPQPGGLPQKGGDIQSADSPFGMGRQGPTTSPTQNVTGSGTPTPGYDRAPSFTPLPAFQPPTAPDAATWTPERFERFTLPTGQDALNQDPGYQFRLDQGRNVLEGSAAARGLLRSGGTLTGITDYGQRAASQEYGNVVNRALAAFGANQSSTQQNNAFGLQGAQFNAGERQQNYMNRYTGANQQYAYQNQQNLAGNAQALSGYQTDVGRELGHRGLDITREQNQFMNSLNGQQQQWMQMYMQNGQSFDQAYRMMMARLQYPA